ncbi:hypothetical protein ACNKHR_04215 [Shigella flexneri]
MNGQQVCFSWRENDSQDSGISGDQKADVDRGDRCDRPRISDALRFGIGEQRGEFLLEGTSGESPFTAGSSKRAKTS